jgi:hypothetical protein
LALRRFTTEAEALQEANSSEGPRGLFLFKVVKSTAVGACSVKAVSTNAHFAEVHLEFILRYGIGAIALLAMIKYAETMGSKPVE